MLPRGNEDHGFLIAWSGIRFTLACIALVATVLFIWENHYG